MLKKLFCSIGMFFLLFSFVLFPGLVLAGPTDEVKVALDYDPSTINMLEFKTGIDLPVILHMHEALMSSDPVTGKRDNNLATSFTVLENRKDIRIMIEKGHTFHTGDPVTAHDVKWTYEQVADPVNANILAGPAGEIEEIEVLDDHTLIFHFYEPYGPWDDMMWIGICSKNYFEKVGREEFRSKPVGSGPFRFVSRKRGRSVTLEADANYRYKEPVHDKKTLKILKYAKKKVDYKSLKFITVTDKVTQLAMLETGELDLITDVMPHFIKRLQRNKNIKVKRISDVPSLIGLAIKPDNYPIWKDRNLRLAIQHAIDKQTIVDRVFLGEGYPLHQYCSRVELGYDPTVKREYDPEKSINLLKASPYVPGTPMILTYTSSVPSAPLVATIVQKYLHDIGLTVKLQQLEEGVAATYARTKDNRQGHMTLYRFDGSRDPNLRLVISVLSDSEYSSWTTRPDKEEIDRLILAQQSEPDRKKRLAIIKKFQAVGRKEPSGVALFGLNQIYAMTDRIDYTWTPKEASPFHLQRVKIVK
ncbi:MAG: ABC transporter substrate-binding protein [Deltaproteobacteria bacterium]|nr:ABC transporter substrate-binding protein [Deltaproteobacteria bacterium]